MSIDIKDVQMSRVVLLVDHVEFRQGAQVLEVVLLVQRHGGLVVVNHVEVDLRIVWGCLVEWIEVEEKQW